MYRRLPSHFEGGAPHKKMSRSDSGCCIDCILRRMQLGKLNRKTGTATEAFVGKGGGVQFLWERLACIHTLGFSIWNLCKTTVDTFWHLTRHTLAQIRRRMASPYLHMPSASFRCESFVEKKRRIIPSPRSLFVDFFFFLFFYWPHSHLYECATDFPHLGNTFGTRHVTRPALLSLTIQVHALNKYSISNAFSFLKREEQHCHRFLLAKRKR